MIYVTTSNGLYKYSGTGSKIEKIYQPDNSLELFGITYLESANKVIFASRLKAPWYALNKKSRSVSLYSIEDGASESKYLCTVNRVYDVHQIASAGNYIFLTDTSKNRIHILDLHNNKIVKIVNFGKKRKDTNHINALCVSADQLLIGLNNRGYKDAEIASIPLHEIFYTKQRYIQGDSIATFKSLKGRVHTHDITPYKDTFLVSASHDGCVFQVDSGENIFCENHWIRGTAVTEKGIWVGVSKKAERALRHSVKLSGMLLFVDIDSKKVLIEVSLEGAGQVNDVLYLPE